MVCRYEPFHVDGGARSIGSLDGQAAHASIIAGVVLPGISTDACMRSSAVETTQQQQDTDKSQLYIEQVAYILQGIWR
jgi:hypothetical protein